MKVSVVIPVYNRCAVVQRTLQSVLSQTYRPLQVVLVDNCSTDGTLSVLEAFAAEHDSADFGVVVTSESHRTAGAARNRGLNLADGEWLLFFDSDDVMHPHLIERYMRIVTKHQGEVDIISARSRLVFPDGTSRQLPFFGHDMLAVEILHSQLATQRYAVRREFFESTDRWNIDLPAWNDWELGARLLLAEPRIAFMGGSTDIDIIKSDTGSITGSEFHSRHGQWERVIDVVENEVRCSSLTNRRRYYRLLDYRRLILAAHYQREGYADLAAPLRNQAMASLSASYGNNLVWRTAVGPLMRLLYRHIAAGRRGAARIARLVLR